MNEWNLNYIFKLYLDIYLHWDLCHLFCFLRNNPNLESKHYLHLIKLTFWVVSSDKMCVLPHHYLSTTTVRCLSSVANNCYILHSLDRLKVENLLKFAEAAIEKNFGIIYSEICEMNDVFINCQNNYLKTWNTFTDQFFSELTWVW